MSFKERFLEEWNSKNTFEKITSVAFLVIAVIVCVLAVLQFTGLWTGGFSVAQPLIGCLLLIQGAENWRTNKAIAVICACTGVVIFLMGFGFFIK